MKPEIWAKLGETERLGAVELNTVEEVLAKNSDQNSDSFKSAARRARLIAIVLGQLDRRLVWSLVCAGSSIEETTAWLFGDGAENVVYCQRRFHDALAAIATYR